MKKTLLLAGLLCLAQSVWAQSLKPVAQQVMHEKQISGNFPEGILFQQQSRSLTADLLDRWSDGALLTLNTQGIETIRTNNPDHFELSVPTPGGGTMVLELIRGKVFSPEFKVRQSSDPLNPVNVDLGQHYWGIVKDHPETLAGISIFNGEIMGIINTATEKYILAKVPGDAGNAHIIYRERDMKIKNQHACSTDMLEEIESEIPGAGDRTGPDNCVRVYMEADYTIFQNKGSVANATAYITGFFSQVVLLYANESINMVLNELLVWSTPDPYTGPSSSQYLTQFRNALNGVYNGDIAHLVGFTGGGGIAYVDVLCNNYYGVGYSGINTTYSNVPTYSWTVEVVTHEMGHNLGSSHTHACVWNGNNTAIDGCGPQAGYSEGCTGPIPTAGTIMSYCHLISGVGIDFNLGFGPQPGDRIRSEVYNAPCLAPCGGGGACSYTTINSNNFESGFGIWTDGGTDCIRVNNAAYAKSGTYSIDLRDNTNTSLMSTTSQNWTAYEEITVEFSYITTSFDNSGEDFWLQLSNNGGASYTTKGDWNYSVQFTNNVRGTATVVIPGPFATNSRLRIRCDASADDDNVYVDDVIITGCTNALMPGNQDSEDRFEPTENTATVFGNVRISPNPVSDILKIAYTAETDTRLQAIVYDLTGRIVLQQTCGTQVGENLIQLDLSQCTNGMYFVQLVGNDQTYSEKVLVKR